MHVPASPAELDAVWLQAALAEVPLFEGARILGVERTVIGIGYGLDGIAVHIALAAEGGRADRPDSLVAKLSPYPRGRDEITFYERIAPHMPIRLARYYAGYGSEADARAVMLLEDLTSAVQGDCIKGADRAQGQPVLHAMARFHAAFVDRGHPGRTELRPWQPKLDELARKIEERLPRFRERYEPLVEAQALARVPELPERLPELVARMQACETSLVHTDLHLDNVLFLDDGEPVILDWPDARLGPPILDVVRVFVEGLSLEARRAHGPALLASYAAARDDAGAPCPSAPALADMYEAAVLWHFATTVSWGGADNAGFDIPRVREIVENLVRTTSAAVADLP